MSKLRRQLQKGVDMNMLNLLTDNDIVDQIERARIIAAIGFLTIGLLVVLLEAAQQKARDAKDKGEQIKPGSFVRAFGLTLMVGSLMLYLFTDVLLFGSSPLYATAVGFLFLLRYVWVRFIKKNYPTN